MAVPTTSITGNILAPDGSAPTSGRVTARLSAPGSALDGAATVRVGSEVSANLTTGGAISIALVPNDDIVPSGTYYQVLIIVVLANGRRMQWAERWSVPYTPTPIDVGSVPRLSSSPTTYYTTEAAVAASVIADAQAIADEASVSASAASASAAAALVSAAAAGGAESGAQAAQAAAEAAQAAALIQAGVYTTEPIGRAAVADGVAFKVQGAGEVAAYEYRRVNAGSSTLLATYPALSAVTAAQDAALAARRNAPSIFSAALRSAPGAVTTLRAKGREAITVVRSTAGEVWANGARVACGANVARVSDDPWGLLIEGARTQYVTAPTAPVNETITLTTGVHAVSIEGTGQVVVTNGTGTATGSPLTFTGRTPGTFAVTVAGTFTLTYSGTVTFAQVEKFAFPTSRLTTAGAAAADQVSVTNPLAGKAGAWHIDCTVELRGRSWTTADYKPIWTLGDWPYSHPNCATLTCVGDSIYLDVWDGSNGQKRITVAAGANLGSRQRHRFVAGADELGNLFITIDGGLCDYSTAGAGTGIIAVQPSTLHVGCDGTLHTAYVNGAVRDLEIKAGDPEPVDVKRPRYLMAGDSIYMPAGLRDAIKAELAPDIVPHIDCVAIGGDTMGTAFLHLADKHYFLTGGPFYPVGQWVEMTRTVPVNDYEALIIEYGRNEPALVGQSPSNYQHTYDKLIHQALKLGVQRVLAGTPPPLANGDLLSWYGADPYSATYRANLAATWEKWGLRGVDTYGAFLDLVTRGQKTIADLMSDTAHANTASGWSDIARRLGIGLREIPRSVIRAHLGSTIQPTLGGTVRSYIGGSQVTGAWAREYLDGETHLGLNAGNPYLQFLPRLIGMRDQTTRASDVGARLIWPAAKAQQIWLHLVLETGGGTMNMYVNRGTGGQVLRSQGAAGGERIISVLMAEGLAAGVDHTPEIQITGAGPVNILGVTYVGGDG